MEEIPNVGKPRRIKTLIFEASGLFYSFKDEENVQPAIPWLIDTPIRCLEEHRQWTTQTAYKNKVSAWLNVRFLWTSKTETSRNKSTGWILRLWTDFRVSRAPKGLSVRLSGLQRKNVNNQRHIEKVMKKENCLSMNALITLSPDYGQSIDVPHT